MPTTVTSSIGTASRDYSTLQAWEDACPANLVTDDKIWRGECYNDSEFLKASGTLLSVAGITCDATRYLELTAATGQSFLDTAWTTTDTTTSGVRLRVTGSYAKLVDVSANAGIYLSRLQLYYDTTYGSNYYTPIYYQTYTLGGINNCFLKTRRPGTYLNFRCDSATAIYVVNCVVLATGTTGSTQAVFAGKWGGIKNCTILHPSDIASAQKGFADAYGRPPADNCAVLGLAVGWGDTSHTGNYNVTTDSWAPGANSVTSVTLADQIEDDTSTTPDVRPKSGSALINAGTRDQTYTNDLDIMGNARSTTTPTVGAFEYASAAVASLILSMRNRQQHLLIR